MCWVMPPASVVEDVRLADRVQQPRLAVVDVTHDRDDRRTGDQIFVFALVIAEGEVEVLEQLAVLVLGADDLDRVVQLGAEQLQRLFVDRLRRRDHLAEVEHHRDERGRVGVDALGEVRQRRAAGQPQHLTVAARNLHATQRGRRHVVEFLTPLLLALATTRRPAALATERTGRAGAATAATGATATGTGRRSRRHRHRDRRAPPGPPGHRDHRSGTAPPLPDHRAPPLRKPPPDHPDGHRDRRDHPDHPDERRDRPDGHPDHPGHRDRQDQPDGRSRDGPGAPGPGRPGHHAGIRTRAAGTGAAGPGRAHRRPRRHRAGRGSAADAGGGRTRRSAAGCSASCRRRRTGCCRLAGPGADRPDAPARRRRRSARRRCGAVRRAVDAAGGRRGASGGRRRGGDRGGRRRAGAGATGAGAARPGLGRRRRGRRALAAAFAAAALAGGLLGRRLRGRQRRAAGKASCRRRTTGASTVEDGPLTYSPSSASFAKHLCWRFRALSRARVHGPCLPLDSLTEDRAATRSASIRRWRRSFADHLRASSSAHCSLLTLCSDGRVPARLATATLELSVRQQLEHRRRVDRARAPEGPGRRPGVAAPARHTRRSGCNQAPRPGALRPGSGTTRPSP